jgi:hypothetical protein
MDYNDSKIFPDLPAALVEEMLDKSEAVGNTLCKSFFKVQNSLDYFRKKMKDSIKFDSDLPGVDTPSSCGIDGGTAIDKLLATDFFACAAIAIEGLTPPSVQRKWGLPHHRVYVHCEKHTGGAEIIARGIMFLMEIELAYKTPHDIVFLDGSFTTPLIKFKQALEINNESKSSDYFQKNLADSLENFAKIIGAPDADGRLWVSLTKYTTRKELGCKFGWADEYDDRAMLTNLLEPGEFTEPVPLDTEKGLVNLNVLKNENTEKTVLSINESLKNIHVIYYKPHKWSPAYCIEITRHVADDISKIASVLKAIKFQSEAPGIFELYPLYLADRMVKQLAKTLPALRRTTTGKIVEQFDGDIEKVFFSMHSYRTTAEY